MATFDFISLVGSIPDAWHIARGVLNGVLASIDSVFEDVEAAVNYVDRVRQVATGTVKADFIDEWPDHTVATLPEGSIVSRRDTPVQQMFLWDGSNWIDFRPIHVSTSAPTVNDDANDGFSVGWRWFHINAGTASYDEYVCLKDTVGAAVWRLSTFISTSTQDYILLRDEVASGGAAQAQISANTWTARRINVEETDTGGHCTLAGNRFTLAAGTYRITAYVTSNYVQSWKVRLRNISDSANTLIGTNSFNYDSTVVTTAASVIVGRFTIATSKTFEIQQYQGINAIVQSAYAGAGVNEEYLFVELIRESS